MEEPESYQRTFQPGPAAQADFEQDKARAMESLRAATHGFVVSTTFIDEDGDPALCYYCQVNPNDRKQMTLGWTIEWYQTVLLRTKGVFELIFQNVAEQIAESDDEDEL